MKTILLATLSSLVLMPSAFAHEESPKYAPKIRTHAYLYTVKDQNGGVLSLEAILVQKTRVGFADCNDANSPVPAKAAGLESFIKTKCNTTWINSRRNPNRHVYYHFMSNTFVVVDQGSSSTKRMIPAVVLIHSKMLLFSPTAPVPVKEFYSEARAIDNDPKMDNGSSYFEGDIVLDAEFKFPRADFPIIRQ